MSKCKRQLRITEAIEVRGSNDTLMLFEKHENYCYDHLEYVANRCDDCLHSYKFNKTLHFVVIIDSEEFFISEYNAVHDSEGMPEYFKSHEKYMEHLNPQPKDWKKAYLALTGIDITKTECVQYAHHKEVEEIMNKANAKE